MEDSTVACPLGGVRDPVYRVSRIHCIQCCVKATNTSLDYLDIHNIACMQWLQWPAWQLRLFDLCICTHTIIGWIQTKEGVCITVCALTV